MRVVVPFDILFVMSNQKIDKRSLIIGDCHGHTDRLEALLLQEGILRKCPDSGTIRHNNDVEVIQLGDLGHFGDTQANDRSIWTYASKWLDIILWGNHDRAVIDGGHFFMGYQKPFPETLEMIKDCVKNGQLRLAHESHGFLLTHAGLHSSYKYNDAPQGDATTIANWLNEREQENSQNEDFIAIRDAISHSRGGRSKSGGILWRDASESLYKPVRQIFGHSAAEKVRRYQAKGIGDSFCIDVGQQFNGRLAAIWLPEEKIVEIKLAEDDATRKLREEQEKKAREFWDDPRELWRMLVV